MRRDGLRRRLKRDVRVVEGQEEEEWFVLVARDELRAELRLSEFAFAALRRFAAGVRPAREVFVETVVGGLMTLAAQMPLADRRGDVAPGLSSCARVGTSLGRKALEVGFSRRCEARSVRPGRNVVIFRRAGLWPVRTAAREGEQTEPAA